MQTINPRLKDMAAYLLIVVCLGAALSLSPMNDPMQLGEDGLFEMAQAFILLFSAGLWLVLGRASRSVNVLVASIMLVFFGREVSWMRVYGASPELVDILKVSHAILLAATLLALGIFWCWPKTRQKKLFRKAAFSGVGAWLLLGLCLMLLGDVFEKKFLPIESNLFWEEWVELCAYICLPMPLLLRRESKPSAS